MDYAIYCPVCGLRECPDPEHAASVQRADELLAALAPEEIPVPTPRVTRIKSLIYDHPGNFEEVGINERVAEDMARQIVAEFDGKELPEVTELTGVTVKGRGRLVADVVAHAQGIKIRLDDERDDAFWAEVEITAAGLAELLRRVPVRLTEETNPMGVDLRLLPFDCDHGDFAFSHTLLDCERRRDLWPLIEKLPALKVPKGFTSFSGRAEGYEETCYGDTVDTPYGTPLTYTTAERLLTLRTHEGVTDNWKNRAIWAYLAELPPETKVALYWH